MGKSLDYYEKDRWEELSRKKGATKKGEKRSAGKRHLQRQYLAEQDLDLALLTFGGKVDLVAGAFERNLDSIKLRNAIARFCEQYDLGERERYYTRDVRRNV